LVLTFVKVPAAIGYEFRTGTPGRQNKGAKNDYVKRGIDG
jgi:hypothetical protein